MERRLAAILAADVVGYTRLMGADEAGTLRRVTELRQQVLDPSSPSTVAASSSSWATGCWSSSPAWWTRSPARWHDRTAWPRKKRWSMMTRG